MNKVSAVCDCHEGHEQAPPLASACTGAVADADRPVQGSLLQMLCQDSPTMSQEILDCLRKFVAPLPELRHGLEQWAGLPQSHETSDAAQRILADFSPSGLGCSCRSAGIFHDDFKFQPQLRPFPLECLWRGKGVILCGLVPESWLCAVQVDPEPLTVANFWDAGTPELVCSALAIGIPPAPCPCRRIWDFGSASLRVARKFGLEQLCDELDLQGHSGCICRLFV